MGITAESSSAPSDDISLCTHIWLFSEEPILWSLSALVDKTRQRPYRGDTRCNLFMESRSVNNSVDIWSLTYLVGHKARDGTCQKEVYEDFGAIRSYLKQMDISDYSLSTTATLPNVEQS